MDKKEIIKEIEDKLKLAITLSILFPTLSTTFLGTANNITTRQLTDNILQWSILIPVYVLSYVFFQFSKRKINTSECILKLLHCTLLIGISSFAFAIIRFIPAPTPAIWFGLYIKFH